MYLALLTWLPGIPSLLHPSVIQGVMEALGIWQPHILKSMLPVLLALVVVSNSPHPRTKALTNSNFVVYDCSINALHGGRLRAQLQ